MENKIFNLYVPIVPMSVYYTQVVNGKQVYLQELYSLVHIIGVFIIIYSILSKFEKSEFLTTTFSVMYDV